ncbi:hypothetical protein BSR29_06720 [Boudabousia liubingyangii]|uniref:Guanylate cyclase domain-containing protein n=2 Tax=Boudabousia liubingyangii TaxID=1921764 RepID=A0A1Q5PL22_9ACTO|nr:hypothetical protein BSR28_07560 [Boudabousia liubingyangii]OKL47332.1 hypothetical protein BSR29_06720 [Boudabousia liubingyangii]
MRASRTHPESTIAQLQKLLIGGEKRYTLAELAEQAQVTEQVAADFWRAMGFADTHPDQRIFTNEDVAALVDAQQLLASKVIDESTLISMLRAHSYISDRLALWQVEALVEDRARRLALDDTSARLVMLDHMRMVQPLLEKQTIYAMRRHLYSLLERTDAEYARRGRDEYAPNRYPLRRSLGFVDMVSYTSTSARLGPMALARLIKKFEYLARDVITSRGARIVKNIGDAVFYIADDLQTAADVVCALVERFNASEDILPVRASLVEGYVVSRSGDVFGPPVNLASRLVDSAPQGGVCLDAQTAQAIEAAGWGEEYYLREIEPLPMQGLGIVERYLLNRRNTITPSV